MNTIIIAGKLVRDAELRAMPNGKPVVSFSLADNTSASVPAIFWNCAYISEKAPNITPHLLKGNSITVVGNFVHKEWTDKSGVTQKSASIYVRELSLQGSKISQDGNAVPYKKPTLDLNKSAKDKAAVDDYDDIPF
jgi:single-strand DNA-binding protein|tara:strand:- start:477 stop:884 length:408 start_codon:yes stop_codon:yes gene_type:complete